MKPSPYFRAIRRRRPATSRALGRRSCCSPYACCSRQAAKSCATSAATSVRRSKTANIGGSSRGISCTWGWGTSGRTSQRSRSSRCCSKTSSATATGCASAPLRRQRSTSACTYSIQACSGTSACRACCTASSRPARWRWCYGGRRSAPCSRSGSGAKLIFEQVVGPVPFTAESVGGPVVVAAHLYGTIGGLLAEAAAQAARRRSRV